MKIIIIKITNTKKRGLSRVLEYLSKENPYFRGSDTFLYDSLINLAGGKECDTEKVVYCILQLNYHSNCMSVFEFYLPMISHFLYFKPEYTYRLLNLLVEPLFALGAVEHANDFISIVQKNVSFYKNCNSKFYLSEYGEKWVDQMLPKLTTEIQQIINGCKLELEEA